MSGDNLNYKAMGLRLIRTRKSMRYSVDQFADLLEVDPATVEAAESGDPATWDVIVWSLGRVPGLSIDWIALGKRPRPGTGYRVPGFRIVRDDGNG